jgi:NADH:ubiquinone oxidoreductase subunit 3 (subunit A)
MTERKADWERWQEEWQRGGSAQATVSAGLRLTAKARRELLFSWLIETVIGSASLVLVILALGHAGNAFEAGLGMAVGLGIGTVWAQRILLRRREQASETAASDNYLVAIRNLRSRQMRLAQFVWIVLTLELVFLIPWWVFGSRVHSRRLTDLGSVLTMWLPIVGFIALFVWSLRLRRRAYREIKDIDRLRADYRGELGAEIQESV